MVSSSLVDLSQKNNKRYSSDKQREERFQQISKYDFSFFTSCVPDWVEVVWSGRVISVLSAILIYIMIKGGLLCQI